MAASSSDDIDRRIQQLEDEWQATWTHLKKVEANLRFRKTQKLKDEWQATKTHLEIVESNLWFWKERKQQLEESAVSLSKKRVLMPIPTPQHSGAKNLRDTNRLKLASQVVVLLILTWGMFGLLYGIEGLKTTWLLIGPVVSGILAGVGLLGGSK